MNARQTTGSGRIKDVRGTAFVVAEFRAEENGEDYPLYRDSIVNLFLNEDTKRAAGSVAASFPPVKDLVKIRTKYFDETLEKQIRSDVRQVVILGAGLDTRAARKPAPDLIYFEIDNAETLRLKQSCYEQQGMFPNVKFIPGNYVSDGFIDLLRQNDFNRDLPTYIIWEGNTMYLRLEMTKQVLQQIRQHIRRFRLSFDYMAEAVITKTTGDPGIVGLVEAFAKLGAPWLSGIADIGRFSEEMNLRVIENFKTAELPQAYWPTDCLTSPIFNFYSLCTLGSD